MLNNIMKRIFFIIALLTLLSCVKDDFKSYTCTIYLQAKIWSKQTVSNCDICISPAVGYTASCQEN